MAFKSPLTVTPFNLGKRQWMLTTDLNYQGKQEVISVPATFVTNFASIPRILWPFISPMGPHALAAVVHDYLYDVHVTSRKDADGIFRRIMREQGVSLITRWTMYLAVRAFGWLYW